MKWPEDFPNYNTPEKLAEWACGRARETSDEYDSEALCAIAACIGKTGRADNTNVFDYRRQIQQAAADYDRLSKALYDDIQAKEDGCDPDELRWLQHEATRFQMIRDCLRFADAKWDMFSTDVLVF